MQVGSGMTYYPIRVQVLNASAFITDAQVAAYCLILNEALQHAFAPAWGIYARIEFTSLSAHPDPALHSVPADPAAWWAVIEDGTRAGYLAYHEHTAADQPLSHVYTGYASAPQNWHYGLSHEIWEMLINPFNNREAVQLPYGVHVPLEVCDAVEPTWFPQDAESVANFCYPSWFDPDGRPPYDHLGLVMAPFQVLPGGRQPT